MSLVFAACSGSSSGALDPNPTETAPTTAVDTATTDVEEPATADPVLTSDDDLIAAALAAYEATPAPDGTIAWDVLDQSVFDDIVSFRMCTWDGLTAFDQTRDVRFRTSVAADGTITATNVQSSPTSGDCLNSALIESAIDAINTHDDYWQQILLNPADFEDDPKALEIFTTQTHNNLRRQTAQWVEDEVQFQFTSFAGLTADSLNAPIAWRQQSSTTGSETFEIVSCREMDAAYGLYRNGTLLDDFKAGTIEGRHSITLYRLVADRSAPTGWRMDKIDSLIWGDCFNTGDWLQAVETWQPPPSTWTAFEL